MQAAAELLSEAAPDVPTALVGYSFGCALLPHVRVPGPPCPRVLIAPTVGRHDYDPYRTVDGPLLVVASEDDFATDCRRLRAWFDGLGARRQLILRCFDNHFFRGHEGWLVEAVSAFLREQWGE